MICLFGFKNRVENKEEMLSWASWALYNAFNILKMFDEWHKLTLLLKFRRNEKDTRQ